MSGYIFKDWYAARLVESVCEPTLTGIASNKQRRKLYWDAMEQYAIFICRYLFIEKKDEELEI